MQKIQIKECKKILKRINKRKIKISKFFMLDRTKNTELKMDELEIENNADWEIYKSKILIKEILNELGNLKTYEYPTEQSSVFLLPDGKMTGSDVIFDHHRMLGEIIGELDTWEFFTHLAAMQIVKLVVDDSILYIKVSTRVTKIQKTTLRNLLKCGKYKDYSIDSYNGSAYSNDKSMIKDDIYKMLGLKRRK